MANRKVRRAKKGYSGGNYKKLYNSWDITDVNFCVYTVEEYKRIFRPNCGPVCRMKAACNYFSRQTVRKGGEP